MESKPFTGAIYLCGKCGNLFNNLKLECPNCANGAKLEDVELELASAILSETDEDTEEPPKQTPENNQ
jgi:uncharacterized OB-fold protein